MWSFFMFSFVGYGSLRSLFSFLCGVLCIFMLLGVIHHGVFHSFFNFCFLIEGFLHDVIVIFCFSYNTCCNGFFVFFFYVVFLKVFTMVFMVFYSSWSKSLWYSWQSFIWALKPKCSWVISLLVSFKYPLGNTS